MAVRFLPPGDSEGVTPSADREELAEVLDLRSRLPQIFAQHEERAQSTTGPRIKASTRERGASRDLANVRSITALPASRAVPAATSSSEVEGARSPHHLDGEESDGEESTAAPRQSAYEDGVKLLARKALSSGELRRQLIAIGHDHVEVERVIDEFVTGLYLDDLGLSRVLTETLRDRKRASRSQIRMKLRERLLPDHAIDEALGELDDDEEFALLQTVAEERARRLSGLDRVTAERRLLGFLARRGWSGERAIRIAREALSNQGKPDQTGRGSVRFQ